VDSLSLGGLQAFTVATVAANGLAADTLMTPATLSTASGAVVIQTGSRTSHDLNLSSALQVGGAVLLQAAGAVHIAADLSSNAQVSAQAGTTITLGAGADLSAVTSVDMLAGHGALSMASDASVTAGTNARLEAVVGDIALSTIVAQKVSLKASGLVSDSHAQDGATANVRAGELRVSADGFGTVSNAIEMDVALLSASVSAQGLNVATVGNVTLGSTSAIAVNRVLVNGVDVQAITDAVQTGVAGVGGSIRLVSGNGITMEDATVLRGDAGISLQTVGNFAMEQLQASAGNVSLVLGGALMDGSSSTDISALGLSISGGNIGSSGCDRSANSQCDRRSECHVERW
jgi:hypothetical protein